MSQYATVGSRDAEVDFSDDDFDDDVAADSHERGEHTAGETASLLAADSRSPPGPNEPGKKARKSGEVEPPSKGAGRLRWWAALTIAAICLILAIYLTGVLRDDEAQSDSDGDDLTVSNYYTELNGDFATKYPWSDQYLMVEPHISTTLTLSSALYDSLGEDVQWEIEVASGSYIYPTGRIVTASFNDTGFLAVRCASASSSDRRRRRLSSVVGCDTSDANVWPCLPKMLARLVGRSSNSGGGGGDNDASKRRLRPQQGRQLRRRKGRRPPRMVESPARGSNAPSSLSTTTYTWTEVYMNCLYVRRELRTLSDDDRNAFFDTAEVLFRTPTDEGQDLYGSKYYGMGTFAMAHNILAGNSDCDHMHDGLGFTTNHVTQTVQFEQALQSVNPRVSVPYWDYTIDMTAYETSGDISSFFDSAVFGSDYFGSAQSILRSDNGFDDDAVVSGLVDPSGRILTGRFTDVEMSASYWGEDSGSVQNAYGHIRSPWNNNNDPYVNRFNMTYGFSAVGSGQPDGRRKLSDLLSEASKPPRLRKGLQRTLGESSSTEFGSADCKTIYDVMQYTTWYDFGENIQYQPHGPIHTLIGGTYGADYKSTIKSLAVVDVDFVEAWALLAFGIFKDMWRAGQVTCPTSCSADTSVEDCKCYCPDIDKWTTNSSTAKAKLEAIDILFSDDTYTTDADGNDISIYVLKILCNDYDSLNPVIGESLQSSSPLDITFWPTHPGVDRLVHWKRIATGFDDTAWGPDGVDVEASCYGHSRDDKLIWKNLFDESDYYYTNGELFDIFDPTPENAEDYQLTYVYDNFLWEHCEDMGYPGTLFDDGESTSGAGDDGVDDGRIDDDGDDDVSTAGDDVLADDFE